MFFFYDFEYCLQFYRYFHVKICMQTLLDLISPTLSLLAYHRLQAHPQTPTNTHTHTLRDTTIQTYRAAIGEPHFQ